MSLTADRLLSATPLLIAVPMIIVASSLTWAMVASSHFGLMISPFLISSSSDFIKCLMPVVLVLLYFWEGSIVRQVMLEGSIIIIREGYIDGVVAIF